MATGTSLSLGRSLIWSRAARYAPPLCIDATGGSYSAHPPTPQHRYSGKLLVGRRQRQRLPSRCDTGGRKQRNLAAEGVCLHTYEVFTLVHQRRYKYCPVSQIGHGGVELYATGRI